MIDSSGGLTWTLGVAFGVVVILSLLGLLSSRP